MNKTAYNPNNEVTTYFKIDKKWYGQNKIITVTFNGGNYDGRTYQYNHDEVYKNTISHYEKLGCWRDYGYFTNTSNIPKNVQKFVTEIS
jgi:hypothetical protein